jgi:glycosyltransferase involved in cell wall biosynthesis
VRYLGASVEPEVQFRAATLLLSTSREESFGLAVLEAMASGVPVVATAVGGVPELVEDEVNGLLFQPAEWERTAIRVAALLAAPERLEALRQACLARAAPLRETPVIAHYESFYREAARRSAA